MKILTYGFDKESLEVLHWYFGKADYVDVTPQYQDVLALYADKVVIDINHTEEKILSIIREFEMETVDDTDTEYIYIERGQIEMWVRAFKEWKNQSRKEEGK